MIAANVALFSLAACGDSPRGTTSPNGGGADAIGIEALDDPQRDAYAMPDRVVDSLPLTSGMVVADLGAGSGYFSRRLARKVPDGKVIAIDIDLAFKQHIEANRTAWGTPNLEARLALNDNPVLQVDTVDLVFVSDTYPYIRDRSTYFAIVHEALRTPGYLVIVGFRADAKCEGVPTCPSADARTDRETVVRELQSSGFELASEETFLPHQYLLVFRKVAK